MARFSDDTLRRYSRQILLREVGGRGQQALLNSRVDLLVRPRGGGIAAIAAQYLLRAGAAHVRWFAASESAAQALRALQAIEQEPPAPEQQTPRAEPVADDVLGLRKNEARLHEAPLDECPTAMQGAPPDALCIAAWQTSTHDAALCWATERGCGRSAMTLAASDYRDLQGPHSTGCVDASVTGDPLDADALVLGSALALGMIQGLLTLQHTPGTYFEPWAASARIREAWAQPHAADEAK